MEPRHGDTGGLLAYLCIKEAAMLQQQLYIEHDNYRMQRQAATLCSACTHSSGLMYYGISTAIQGELDNAAGKSAMDAATVSLIKAWRDAQQ